MTYELDEETATTLRTIVGEWHAAMTALLQRSLKSTTGQAEIAAIESGIAKTNRQRDEVLAALDGRKGA